MGSTVHLWTAFVGLVTFQHFLRLLSAAFTELLTPDVSIFGASRSIKGAFQGVTPSFHLSEYQFYETDLFSKLLSIFLFFSQLHA